MLFRSERVDGKKIVFKNPVKVKKIKWHSDVVIFGGRGMGQYRRVADYDRKTRTLTVVRPWDVLPDADSVVCIGRPLRRTVVYGNYLDAKPRAALSESHIASAGVEPFGSSVELIVDSNTFHQVRTPIATFSPYLFHRYENNEFVDNRVGARFGGGRGTVVRHNRVDRQRLRWCQLGGHKYGAGYSVIEHNQGRNLPVVVRLGNRYKSKISGQTALVYKNRFEHGRAPGDLAIALRTIDPEPLIVRDNRFRGFKKEIDAGGLKK